jgi:hypothetical protein
VSRYRLEPVGKLDAGRLLRDSKGVYWLEREAGVYQSCARFSDHRAAYALEKNLEAFIKRHGRNRVLFFTITDAEGLTPREFARRWHHWQRRHGAWIKAFVRVLELQHNGRPHYHFVVAVDFDVMPERFDWSAFMDAQREYREHGRSALWRELTRQYSASAVPELRDLWEKNRESLKVYGLGRAEALPVRKVSEALAKYVTAYLVAGARLKADGCKGARRVESSRRDSDSWKTSTVRFSWCSAGARQLRDRLAQVAQAFGFTDETDDKGRSRDFVAAFGVRWSWRLRSVLLSGSDEDFQLALAAFVEGRAFRESREAFWEHARTSPLRSASFVRPMEILRPDRPF